MTLVLKVQNMEQEGSLKKAVITHWKRDGEHYVVELEPQREHTIAVHADLPLISIGKERLPADALPAESLAAEARSAKELQAKVDLLEAEKQNLTVDRDRLSAELTRLRDVQANHDPALRDATTDTLVRDHRVLTEAHNRLVDDMKAVEKERDELRDRLAGIEGQQTQADAERVGGVAQAGAGNQSETAQPGSEHSHTPAPIEPTAKQLEDEGQHEGKDKPIGEMTKAELKDEAAARGVEVDSKANKSELKEAVAAEYAERLDKMTKAELIDEAELKGIEIDGSKATKAEIIAKLQA